MMEREYIQKLLDSYMAAETTREEERLLADYFSIHRDIPAAWRDFSILFRGIRQYEQKPYVSYSWHCRCWQNVKPMASKYKETPSLKQPSSLPSSHMPCNWWLAKTETIWL